MYLMKTGRYFHPKSGTYYEVLGIENLSELVVYKALYDSVEFGNESLWVRSKDSFLETIDIQGVSRQRFEYQPEAEIEH